MTRRVDAFGRPFPRTWPQMAVALAIAVPLNFWIAYLVRPGVVVAVVVAVMTPLAVTRVTWWRWRRRNPITPELVLRHMLEDPEEREKLLRAAAATVNDMREQARWN